MPSAEIRVHPEQPARLGSRGGVRLREDSVYTNHKGQEKKGIRKRADQALGELQEPLSKMLEADEAVLYIARAQAPASAFEQLAFSWYIYHVTGTVLVLTNRRLLHFGVTRDGQWKKSLRSVRWGDLKEAKLKGALFNSMLVLTYEKGKKETYWSLKREDGKKIKLLLAGLLPGSVGEASGAEGMVSLCPDCLAALTPRVYQCGQCSLAFKDEKTLLKRSLLIPGGGYFYTGYWFLGIGDFFVEAYLLILVIGSLHIALGPSEQDPGVALVAAGLVAVLLAVEKWFTIHHCKRFIREYIPLK